MRADLEARLGPMVTSPVLLVATDYDGTLAPIVSDPAQAHADPAAMVAIRALAALPQTHVAVISGRALCDLAQLTASPDRVHLVGSHGSEFDPGFAEELPPEAVALRDRLVRELGEIAAAHPGCRVEHKPAAAAFHYRDARDETANRAVDAVRAGPGGLPGVHLRPGKCVLELSVLHTDKGTALNVIRQRIGASAVLFIGDDLTDEDAFATLTGPDLAIKVGPGPTQAHLRVDDPAEVARVLAHLSERRAAWLSGAAAVPIEDHALLSDQRTIALVTPSARIAWLCLPRIDSAAVFAEILGGPTAGFFEIAPASPQSQPCQAFVGNSFVLQTTWDGLTIIDYLDCTQGRAYQRAGRTDLVRVVEGLGRARVTFAPRPDFGRAPVRLRPGPGGLEVEGTIEPMVLCAPDLAWEIHSDGPHHSAVAEFDVDGRPWVFELRFGTANLSRPPAREPQRRLETQRFWGHWAATLVLPSVAPDLVRRSALVVKALCCGPTGAIAAAATTSLPEGVGGVRNWDYRFCWPRDAALAAASLVRLGSTGHAMKLLDWLLGVVERCESPDRLCPLYTVSGHEVPTEGEIGALSGYRGSRPVRIGNAAAQQVQLDVFGPITDLIAMLADRGAAISSEHWRLAEAMVAAVERRWTEPDHGIWEVRLTRRHHVHSKVMCWLTVDRALRVAQALGRPCAGWVELRDRIAADVLAHGYNAELNAFTGTYDGRDADASALYVGLSGLLPADDPRFAGTIALVERELLEDGTVYRYRHDDGLPGREGGFNICTTWLIEAYAMTGRRAEAESLFAQYAALAGPTGLIPEQYDPAERRGLGNHPQLYSHLGLINAAVRLSS